MNNFSLIHFRKYAALFINLLFPLRVMRWLLWFSIACSALGLVLVPIYDVNWIYAVAVAGFLLCLMVSFVVVPSQAISLASCRPFTLLGNTRQWLLIALIVTSFIFSIVVYWSMNILSEIHFSPSLLVLWLMVSILLQISVWLCSRWQGVNGFIFMLNFFFGDIAVWLSKQHPLGLLMVLIVSWGVFSYWWLKWKPEKYQSNNVLLPGLEFQRRQAEGVIATRMMSGKAHSWVGSRLFGAPDDWSARVRRSFVGSAFFVLVFIPFLMIMEREKFWAIIQYGAVIFMLVMAAAVAQGASTSLFRNLHSIWLCSSGSRADLFVITWSRYWRETFYLALLLIVLAIVLELISGAWRGAEIWLLFLVSVLLTQALIFYVTWFIYQKKTASVLWCNWVCVVVFLAWLYLVCATGLLFPLPFEWQGISTLWIWLPQLILIGLLHKPVRSGFSRMNFMRAA